MKYMNGGQIAAIELGKSGVSQKTGMPWQITKYKILHPEGSRWMSTFNTYDFKAGDIVDIGYEEKDNPFNPKFPYTNIRMMREALPDVTEEHVVKSEHTGVEYGKMVPGHKVGVSDEMVITNVPVKAPESPVGTVSQSGSINIPPKVEKPLETPLDSVAVEDLYDL